MWICMGRVRWPGPEFRTRADMKTQSIRPANIRPDPYDPKFYVYFEFEVGFHILYVFHKKHKLWTTPAEPTRSARSMDRLGTTELTRTSNSASNFDRSNQKLGPEH